jgi:hypothetical protein
MQSKTMNIVTSRNSSVPLDAIALDCKASNFWTQTETYDGIDLTMNARLPHAVNITGGLGSGTSNNIDSINSRSNCFVVDSPQQLLNCHIRMPWRTSVKFLGTIPLPGGIDLGLTFQSVPGPQITANYTVTSAAAQGLGRPLSGGSATVPLITLLSGPAWMYVIRRDAACAPSVVEVLALDAPGTLTATIAEVQ